MTEGIRQECRFRAVAALELQTIFALYQAVIGSEGCTWNSDYPGVLELSEDYANGNLFCMEYQKRIIGAVSIVTQNELDDLSCWSFRSNMAEIARVVILPEFQGRGIADQMLTRLFRLLRSRGYLGVHLLAAKINHKAARLYDGLGFSVCGSEHCYGNAYFCRELFFTNGEKTDVYNGSF